MCLANSLSALLARLAPTRELQILHFANIKVESDIIEYALSLSLSYCLENPPAVGVAHGCKANSLADSWAHWNLYATFAHIKAEMAKSESYRMFKARRMVATTDRDTPPSTSHSATHCLLIYALFVALANKLAALPFGPDCKPIAIYRSRKERHVFSRIRSDSVSVSVSVSVFWMWLWRGFVPPNVLTLSPA